MGALAILLGTIHPCVKETQHKRDELGTVEDSLMTQYLVSAGKTLQLKRAEQVLRSQLEPLLRAEKITFEQWQVLAALLDQPGLRMTELAEAAVLPAATLTRHVDRLVELAMIVRRIDVEDKRRVAVALSARGEKLALRLRESERSADIELAASNPASG